MYKQSLGNFENSMEQPVVDLRRQVIYFYFKIYNEVMGLHIAVEKSMRYLLLVLAFLYHIDYSVFGPPNSSVIFHYIK